MANQIEDGGQAVSELTVRDYLAAAALAAIVPTAAAPCLVLNDSDCALVARTSYAIADAMLTARKQQPVPGDRE